MRVIRKSKVISWDNSFRIKTWLSSTFRVTTLCSNKKFKSVSLWVNCNKSCKIRVKKKRKPKTLSSWSRWVQEVWVLRSLLAALWIKCLSLKSILWFHLNKFASNLRKSTKKRKHAPLMKLMGLRLWKSTLLSHNKSLILYQTPTTQRMTMWYI